MRGIRGLAGAALLGLCGCGDDGKVGSQGTPASAPTTGTKPPRGATGTTSPSPARPRDAAKVGDWARWEVRTAGVERVTMLEWRTQAVEAGRVRLRVESTTRDVAGTTVASSTSEEWVKTPTWPPIDPGGAIERLPVAGGSVEAFRVARGETTTWHADAVPLGGVVKSRGPGGVEQTLVAFGRGS